MKIIRFDKSLRNRYEEYLEILSNRGNVVPASRVWSEWSFYIELVIEPTGWRALWKIPRLTCQDFEIHYPSIVVVDVLSVDYKDLKALVKIVAVQDEIHLPEKYDVPLVELYPTQEQENKVLDVIGTADCIDELRFFFDYLWRPWDDDDDDNTDWSSSYLEPRLRLFFDMNRGIIDTETCDIIRSLITEAKKIRAKILKLEADISDEDEEQKMPKDDGKTCRLMRLHLRLQQIKTEAEVMENPDMRNMIARNGGATVNNFEVQRRQSRGRKQEGYFVWHGGIMQDIVESLRKATDFFENDIFFKVSGCLHEALDASDVNDIVAVGEGEHHIRGTCGLENGGTIVGLGARESTILRPKETESGPSLFDFSGGEIFLQNLCLDLGELQAGILVRKGIVKIVGCRVIASNKSVVQMGIVVLPNAKLIAENTTFSGLGTAISIHSSGDATVDGCVFENCIEGVQLQDYARLNAIKCHFSGFKEYAIRMETQRYSKISEGQTGSEGILEHITEITTPDCKFENNGKGNVILRPLLTSVVTPKHDDSTSAMTLS